MPPRPTGERGEVNEPRKMWRENPYPTPDLAQGVFKVVRQSTGENGRRHFHIVVGSRRTSRRRGTVDGSRSGRGPSNFVCKVSRTRGPSTPHHTPKWVPSCSVLASFGRRGRTVEDGSVYTKDVECGWSMTSLGSVGDFGRYLPGRDEGSSRTGVPD